MMRFRESSWAAFLWNDTHMSWLWLVLRLYLGYQWLAAGLEKLASPAWGSGRVIYGFWKQAVALPKPPARPLIAYGWYRGFLVGLLHGGHGLWVFFAGLIAWGEVLVGVFLVLGLVTGIAAFAGAFMNFNYMLAGSASTNPVLFLLAVILMLAWKTAGYWGLDRWVLPALGMRGERTAGG